MLLTTKDAVKAVLRSDPTLPPPRRKQILSAIREIDQGAHTEPKFSSSERLIRRSEAASRLSVSVRTIDKWASEGLLRKIRLKNRQRACGFVASEIDALLSETSSSKVTEKEK